MKTFPFITPAQSSILLRLTLALFLFLHGASRVYSHGVTPFGEFLNTQGFMIGPVLAWAITVFELTATVLLALGYYVRWIALVFILELLMGIILVHGQHGWFVVGKSLNGVEYSVLLIVCFVVTAAQSSDKKF